jgi:hypothetical protein
MDEPKFTIEEIDDPAFNARIHAEGAQFKNNLHWLSSHWEDVLPQARGRYIAVAGQQPFIADDPVEAERLAAAAHPEDKGILVQYVYPSKEARLYGHRRRMGP